MSIHAGSSCLSSEVHMVLSLQAFVFHLYYFFVDLAFVSGENFVSNSVSVIFGWYAGIVLNLLHIFPIFSKRNVADSSTTSSGLLFSGMRFSTLELVIPLTKLKRPFVLFLLSLTCFVRTCLLWYFGSLL